MIAVIVIAMTTMTSVPALASPLDQRIAEHAARNGMPVALARAVIRLESNFRPSASNRGNFGLMQIRLGTARSLGYSGGAAGLLNAQTNLTYGMRYLARAYHLAGGDICGAIMRYQSGLGATRANGANRAYCDRARTIIARNG
ncbi:MAG: transglycosylase SLT domain-containing protein [Hyphomicrobiales bacterium]|nr:transglycosylase SLT domain-containing protein [Hyphomicrobiales bacterium]